MYEYNCKIVRVVDGDTVDVDIDLGFGVVLSNQRVRLYGIDAPESRTRDLIEKKFGLMAKEYLERELGEACVIRTQIDKGKYGRILGEFFSLSNNNMTVNEKMVQQRLAIPYHGSGSREWRKEQHQKNFNYAIEHNMVDL